MKINPNLLTVAGLIFPVIFFILLVNGLYWLALISFVGILFDTVDGAVARATGKTTSFGGVLDSTVDRVADAICISAFYFAGLVSIELILITLVLSYLISYVRSRAELAGGGKFRLDVGMIERTERVLFLAGALFIEALGWHFAPYIFVLLILLSFVTVMQRLMVAKEKLKG